MDLESARKISGYKVAPWRVRLREIFWAHTDFLIKQVEGQYVDERKKPRFDVLEIVVLVLLVVNMIVLGVFDPLQPHSVRSQVAQWIDLSLSILFFIEAIMRVLSFGHIVFVADKWNTVDLCIVILSFIAAILEAAGISFGNFTILRTVRVFRPLRSVTTLPAAKTLVLSIYSAIKSLEDVTVLYILFIVSFSIIGVVQFKGRLRTRCVRSLYNNFTANRSAFVGQFPFAQNYTINDFVCGGPFESGANLQPSMGCGLDATCNNAQFLGNRLLVGYTCPFGYECVNVHNPMFGYVSFDSVPQAMLTIFVGVTAEGLYRVAFQMMDAFDVTAAYYFVAIHVFGTFFIVNLSVVLVTVTFEHVSAKIRDSKPQLVSKMQRSLQGGPRVFRKGRSKSMAGGGPPRPGAVSVTVTGSDGRVRAGSVGEEYAYLLGPVDDDEEDKSASLADVAARLIASGATERQRREREEAEEAERKRKEEQEEAAAAAEGSSSSKKKKKKARKRGVSFADGGAPGGGGGGGAAAEDADGDNDEELLTAEEKMKRLLDDPATLGTYKYTEAELCRRDGEDDVAWRARLTEVESAIDAKKNPMRKKVDEIMMQDYFESVLNGLIIINIGILCTHHYGSSPFMEDFLFVSNIVFACLFGVEFLLKVIHFGPKKYFLVPINVFDFIILVLAIVDVSSDGIFPSVTALRAVRLLKVMKSFPGVLRWTVVILVSIKSSFLLLCTIFVVNYCFAMFGMHMFGGLFCNLATEVDFRPDNTLAWCPNRPRANFDDVATAMMTTFQLMTGDNWDVVMYNAMRSRSWVVALAFVGYIILMTFVLVNILVGILLSGPSRDEVDLIGQKLFGISIEEQAREEEAEAERQRTESQRSLEEWEEAARGVSKGKSAHKLDLLGFADRTMRAMPSKFIDSLEAIEDTILLNEHTASVHSQRRTWQRTVREAMSSRLVENAMLLLLSISSLALAFETPESAPDDPSAIILRILDIVFSVIFLIELFLNFYGFGIVREPDAYLRRDPWNVLDAVLVITNAFGTSSYFYKSDRWFKVLLVVRAVRPLRFVKRSQGLRTVFTAFAMSAVPLKNVVFLALVIWTCWGLMGVQLFMGAFYSCSDATLTTKATCLGPVNTTLEAHNQNVSSFFSPGATTMTTTTAAAATTAATTALASSTTTTALAATTTAASGLMTWSNSTMTIFSNGTIKWWALMPSKNSWTNADLHYDHLGAAFLSLLTLATLDGGVDIIVNGIDSVGVDIAPIVNHRQRVSFYFVSFIFIGGYFLINLVVSVIIDTYNKEKIKNGDNGIFLTTAQNSFLRSHRRLLHGVPQIFYDDHTVDDWKRKVRKIVTQKWFKNMATAVSLINALLLLADYYDAPAGLVGTILVCNFIFALVFGAEVSIKIVSLGWKRFFHSRFNRFDLFVTLCVFVGVIGEVGFPDRGFTFIFRAMRSISLFRVVRNAERLRHVIGRFSYSLYGLANVGALLFIFLYIFGVMGVKSFGLVKYHGSITRQVNFNNVFRAILLLLNALAGGGWAFNMNDCAVEEPYCDMQINDCGVFGWSQAYWVLFIIFTKFVLLNMFIAVILDSFVSTDYEMLAISKDHVAEFFEKWFLLDPRQELRIDSHQLVPFLRSLSPDNPLGFGGTELTRRIGHEFRFVLQLRLHEMDGTIELQDLITALCDATLGVPLPDSEVRSLQKYADRKFHRKERDLYIGKRGSGDRDGGGGGGSHVGDSHGHGHSGSTGQCRVIERFAVHVIEQHWLEFKYRGGRNRGRVGVQSLLRSRAPEQDYRSRRDNLSYLDRDNETMWGSGDGASMRRPGGTGSDGDDSDNLDDLDEAAGARSLLSEKKRERGWGSTQAEHERFAARVLDEGGTVVDARPPLKNYLTSISRPIVQSHRRACQLDEMRKVLAEARVDVGGGTQTKAGVKLVGDNIKVDPESDDLHRLLIDKLAKDWHDEEKQRLESTLKKKQPLGGRMLHAARVIEQHKHQQRVRELEDAERMFVEAGSSSLAAAAVATSPSTSFGAAAAAAAAASPLVSPTSPSSSSVAAASPLHRDFASILGVHEDRERQLGLLSQTKLWRKRQEEADLIGEATSPVSGGPAALSRQYPAARIPGTYAAAGLADQRSSSNYRYDPRSPTSPARLAAAAAETGASPASPSNFASPIRGGSAMSPSYLQQQQQRSVSFADVPFLEGGGGGGGGGGLDLVEFPKPSYTRSDSLLTSPIASTVRQQQRHLDRNRPSAAAAASSFERDDQRHQPPAGAPMSPRDKVEIDIMMQELREWKGETVPEHERVTRPRGYHKEFSADEYASL